MALRGWLQTEDDSAVAMAATSLPGRGSKQRGMEGGGLKERKWFETIGATSEINPAL